MCYKCSCSEGEGKGRRKLAGVGAAAEKRFLFLGCSGRKSGEARSIIARIENWWAFEEEGVHCRLAVL